jgi:CMP-N,N'-diacetyllegionaminic acid synthase
MNVLTVIPARGGSKRVTRKNLIELGGKPLINWTLDLALEIFDNQSVLVSTDNEKIARTAIKTGANVPWLRPYELSQDNSSLVEVTLHALEWFEANVQIVDCILLLQPTSPFRTLANIKSALDLFEKNRNPVITIRIADTPPGWALKIEGEFVLPYFDNSDLGLQSQQLKTAYTPSGSVYAISPHDLRKFRTFFTKSTQPLIINSEKENLDIDTEWDLKIARYLLNDSIK